MGSGSTVTPWNPEVTPGSHCWVPRGGCEELVGEAGIPSQREGFQVWCWGSESSLQTLVI